MTGRKYRKCLSIHPLIVHQTCSSWLLRRIPSSDADINVASSHLLLPRLTGQGTKASVAAAGVTSAEKEGERWQHGPGRERFPRDEAASPKSKSGRGGGSCSVCGLPSRCL